MAPEECFHSDCIPDQNDSVGSKFGCGGSRSVKDIYAIIYITQIALILIDSR
jgi:hypothetical protein